jgi:23S rRNA pseudouridine1911/1915/1917 synthase
MQFPPLDVLYEDNHVLAVSKPARLATMGVPEGQPSLLTVAKSWIKERYAKPGNVYLGVVSRLDAPVTGVVLLARTSKAANRLSQQFRSREVEKVYWAITEGAVDPPQGRLVHWLVAHGRHRRMLIVGPTIEGAKEAVLSYRRLRMLGANSLLEVRLETGRKHQIRIQLADRGSAILGDRKYGAHVKFPLGIALHARRVTFQHPVRDERITIEAPVPEVWTTYGVSD